MNYIVTHCSVLNQGRLYAVKYTRYIFVAYINIIYCPFSPHAVHVASFFGALGFVYMNRMAGYTRSRFTSEICNNERAIYKITFLNTSIRDTFNNINTWIFNQRSHNIKSTYKQCDHVNLTYVLIPSVLTFTKKPLIALSIEQRILQ